MDKFASLPPAAASFLAVARRQTEIEQKLARADVLLHATAKKRKKMESARLEDEIRAPKLSFEEKQKRERQHVRDMINHYIGDILTALEKLPEQNGKRFHIAIKPAGFSSDMSILCSYTKKPQSYKSMRYGKTSPGFMIEARTSVRFSCLDQNLTWKMNDYTYLEKPEQYYSTPATPRKNYYHAAELRSAIARAVARLAPDRLNEIAVAIAGCAQPAPPKAVGSPLYIKK